MTRTLIMFCGQGAQYYQMGRELFHADPIFRDAMDRCDMIAADLGGPRIAEVIFGRPMAESHGFDRLAESNAALLAIGFSLAMRLEAAGIAPDALLGYSLGETIAAVFGGALSLEDGFRLVLGQAEIFARAAPAGAMIAVLVEPARLAALPEAGRLCEIAAVNAPRHCVLSLRASDAAVVEAALEPRRPHLCAFADPLPVPRLGDRAGRRPDDPARLGLSFRAAALADPLGDDGRRRRALRRRAFVARDARAAALSRDHRGAGA